MHSPALGPAVLHWVLMWRLYKWFYFTSDHVKSKMSTLRMAWLTCWSVRYQAPRRNVQSCIGTSSPAVVVCSSIWPSTGRANSTHVRYSFKWITPVKSALQAVYSNVHVVAYIWNYMETRSNLHVYNQIYIFWYYMAAKIKFAGQF
jgi:hypothetical protein